MSPAELAERPRPLTETEKEIFFGNQPMWAVRVQLDNDRPAFRRKLLIRNLPTTEARNVFDDMPEVKRGFYGPLPDSLVSDERFSSSGVLTGAVDFQWIEYDKDLRVNPQSYAVTFGHIALVSPDTSNIEMSVTDTNSIVRAESALVRAGLVFPQR